MTEPSSSTPSPSKPPRGAKKAKGRTAYYLFSSEHRDGVKSDLTKDGVPPPPTTVSKVLGERWQALDPEVKADYKERCESMQAAQTEDAGDEDYDVAKEEAEDKSDMWPEQTDELPHTRVKRLCKLDDEVKNLSHEAVRLIAKATELFVEYMVEEAETYRAAATTKRKSLTYTDVEQSVATSMCMAPWLSQHLFASRPPRKTVVRASPMPHSTPAPACTAETLTEEGGSVLFSPALYTPAAASGATYAGALGGNLMTTPPAAIGRQPL